MGTARHECKRFVSLPDNQDEDLVVARLEGRHGPRVRSTAVALDVHLEDDPAVDEAVHSGEGHGLVREVSRPLRAVGVLLRARP